QAAPWQRSLCSMSRDSRRRPCDLLGLFDKVLALESRKGFQDNAVAGGLAAFAAAQARNAASDGPASETLSALVRLFAGYDRLSARERQERVAQAGQLIERARTSGGPPPRELPRLSSSAPPRVPSRATATPTRRTVSRRPSR